MTTASVVSRTAHFSLKVLSKGTSSQWTISLQGAWNSIICKWLRFYSSLGIHNSILAIMFPFLMIASRIARGDGHILYSRITNSCQRQVSMLPMFSLVIIKGIAKAASLLRKMLQQEWPRWLRIGVIPEKTLFAHRRTACHGCSCCSYFLRDTDHCTAL